MDFKNKKVAILGWGINGIDAAKYLANQDAKITIFDKNEQLDFKNLNAKDFNLSLGNDYLINGLNNFDFVFRTPAVYRYLPELLEAEKSGATITSAIKLFFNECPGSIIGVTGTKGKGTTSTLIYEILKNDGKDVYLAGNIGYPVLELLPKLNKESIVVLELSSFQLIDLTRSPHISVVLNITTDHLDWHKDRKEYLEAKTNIVRHQKINDFVVLNYDYEDSKNFEKLTEAKKYFFSGKTQVKGSYVSNKKLFFNLNEEEFPLGETGKLLLRGEHNWENISAAVCAAGIAKAKIETIRKTVFDFKGLEHRLELVREVGGVKFYNDSFSTNPQTSMAAIKSFEEPITLILGGSEKGLEYNELGKLISEKGNVKNVFLIGEIADKLDKSINQYKFSGNVDNLGRLDMKDLVELCLKKTISGGVVVLSPGTASFDMFNDYKERGKKFKEAVNNLK